MSAWTQLVEPGPALLILVLVIVPQIAYAAPFENSDQSTEIEYYPVADATGCYYNFEHYDEGDRIITNEPCLNCTCHNRMLMCYLRVCPFTKAIGQNCKVEKKPDQCCPVITCPEVPVQLVNHASTTPSTQVGHPNEYGCSIDNLFYADGAKVPSNPENPCEVCYCIRNKTACIIQECTLTGEVVEGCRPVYVDGVCCPVRYDCEHPLQLETTPRPLLTTTTTTLPPTSSPGDCIYNNEVYSDGALVKKDVPCEQCYCMRGDIICAVQECGPTPLDKVNCTALPIKEGQCCPDTYECENISEEDLTTLSYYEVSPTQPTLIFSEEETTESRDEEVSVTKASIPQETPAATEGPISESTESIEAATKAQETPVTESATEESFTSRITEAVEAVTSRVTEIVEAITSTVVGSEKEVTTLPETGTEPVKQEPEASTLPAQPTISEQSTEVTQSPVEEQQPVTVSEPETHSEEQPTEPEIHITEGYTQETKQPDSDEQKLVTIPESKFTVTTESLEKETEQAQTESPETVTDHIDQILHDSQEEPDEEEPQEHENELYEGSGKPLPEEPHVTVVPEEESEDKHTRPIDQSQTEKEQEVTEQPTTSSLPHKDENEPVEGSGESEERTATTLAPEPETVEAEKLPQTTQPSIAEPDVSEIVTTADELTTVSPEESKETESPRKPVSEEPIVPQHCDEKGCHYVPSVTPETVQPLIPGETTEQPKTESPTLPEVEATISELEQPHADVTKQPDEVTQETETKPSDEGTVGPQGEISTTLPTTETHKEEEPSVAVTEATSVTEPEEEEKVSIPAEPPVDITKKKEGEHTTTERQEEELEFVTEMPTKKTEKPQSMDHVYETILPATTIRPESDVQGQEIPEEKVTAGIEGTTELPKDGATEKVDTIKPEHPEEKITEASLAAEDVPTTVPSEISQTPIVCDDDKGCATQQEEADETPAIVEECTKESCVPHGEIPQSEGITQEPPVPQGPAACDSDHDCIPEADKGVTEPSQLPSEKCDTEHGCTPVVIEDKLGEKPICDAEQGCVPGNETEVVPQSCANELDCIPSVPEKEGEKPSLEACQPGSDCDARKEEPVTEDLGLISVSITEAIPGQEQTTLATHDEKQPEEESAGQQPTTETIETVPEVTEHTEGSGETADEDHTEQEIPEGTKAPKLSSEEEADQETEQTVVPERSTEAILTPPEKQPEEKGITTVPPEQLENEIQPETTLAPEYDRTEPAQEISSEGTELPDLSKTPEELSTASPEVPSVTQIPVYVAPEVEVDNEITPQPETVKPEGTEVPETKLTESTRSPEQADNEISTVSTAGVTNLPEGIEKETTQEPELIAPGSTLGPETIPEEVTQLPKEIVTETEPQITDSTQTPEQVTSQTAHKIEGDQIAEHTTLEQVVPESTPSSETVSQGSATRIPEISESTDESTRAPEQVAPESTQSSGEVGGTPAITESSEEPESTQVPEHGIVSEGTEKAEGPLETTQAPETEITGVTQLPEQFESTETPAEVPTESVKRPGESTPESTPLPEKAPEEIAPQATTLPTEVGSGENELPEATQAPEHNVPEATHVPEEVSEHLPESTGSTQIPEQISPEGTRTPEVVPEATEIPDTVPKTQEEVERTETPEYATEVPEVTSPEERVTEVSTEAVTEIEEHGIPGEGNCLVDGQTYKNNSNVPPVNQCQTSCKCISSILQCESVPCTSPPSNMQDCMPIFNSHDSCCPTYTCSVPGATSMESDSHVIETTTATQEEEKPVTIDLQVIPGEQTTTIPETSSEISERGTTIKETEVTAKAETITEIPQENITELPSSKATEKPIGEEESTGTISEELTTQKSSIPEKIPSPEVTEVYTTEIGKDVVPVSQTTAQGEATTVPTKDIVTTEESIKSSEEPAFDETENEVPEEPIVPEQCGVNECGPEIPTLPQVSEHPATETIPEIETEQEVKVTEHPVKEGDLPVTEGTAITEQPVKEGELPVTEGTTITEQPVKEGELPVTEGTAVTEQPITEEYVTVHAVPGETSEGKLPAEELPEGTKLPERAEITTTEAIVEKELVPIGAEKTPSQPEIPGEVSTEGISEEPLYTEEPAVSATEETSKSPEEMAAIPEIEEIATLPSILPEVITEGIVTGAQEQTDTEDEKRIPTTEYHVDIVSTEQPSVQGEGADHVVSSPPEIVETQKPESELDTTPETVTKTSSWYPEYTGQTEVPSVDKETTYLPDHVEITEPQEILETATPELIQVTEAEKVTGKPESAAHITEPVEIEEVTTPVVVEVSLEVVTKVPEQPEDILPESEATTIAQKESKPKDETAAEYTTQVPKEYETVKPESEGSHPVLLETTTIPAEQGLVTEAPAEIEEKETERIETVPSITEVPEKEQEAVTEQIVTEVEERLPAHVSTEKETEIATSVTEAEIKEGGTSVATPTEATQSEGSTEISATEAAAEVSEPHSEPADIYTSPQITTQASTNASGLYTSGPYETPSTQKSVDGELSTSVPLSPISTAEPTTPTTTYTPPIVPEHDIPGEHVPELPDYHTTDDYEYEDQGPIGPGTCRYGGKVYVSAQQIPRDDPCDFCFCFRSDIICLQQSCPPPIPKCHEEPIRGFCCPRYECPVGMATAVNITTSTTTTTTTLPPHFLSHAYPGRVKRAGCQIKGKAYRVGEDIESASGPCLHCTCGGDGEMKCDPKVCSPEPMLRQMIAAATSRRRR